MKKALIAITLCGAAQPALAQWGLFGLAEDGLVYEIDELTGDVLLIGDSGLTIVGAVSNGMYHDPPHTVFALTDDDRVVRINLGDLKTTVLAQITGRPRGYVPVAFGYYEAVLRSPAGDDILYEIEWPAAVYKELGPTGLTDVSGMDSGTVCTTSGGVYMLDWSTGQASFRWGVTNGDALDAITGSDCGAYVTGAGLYRFAHGMTQPGQVRSTGLSHITALAYTSAYDYACEYGTSQFSVCDIFDFLAFQNDWVSGMSRACDCDVSTGFGVCDIFDFLCFQNAWVEASTACP